MSKITGKFQVTLPKRLVMAYDIKVGDEVEFAAAGDRIMLQLARGGVEESSVRDRLRGFDLATDRQRSRGQLHLVQDAGERGWSREELYTRGSAR